jgi:hypothetical protein
VTQKSHVPTENRNFAGTLYINLSTYLDHLDQLPCTVLLLNLHTPVLIQTDSTCMNDSSGQNSRLGRWQTFTLVILRFPLSSTNLLSGIDEFLEGFVSITRATIEASFFIW